MTKTTRAPFGVIERYETEVARLRMALSLIADARRLISDGEMNVVALGCVGIAEKALNGDERLAWEKSHV